MATITDKFGITYTVGRNAIGAGHIAYYALAGEMPVARAVVNGFKGCISDVLVYKESDRRRGIASALVSHARSGGASGRDP